MVRRQINRDFLKFAIGYAFRNLRRNRRRTILTMATVALSVSVSLISVRFTAGALRLWQEGACDTGTGHAQVHTFGYFQQPEGLQERFTMAANSAYEAQLRQDPAVEAVAERLSFEGIISAGDKSVYFLGNGVNPDDEVKVSPRLFVSGKDIGEFVSQTEKGSATIGKGLADILGVKVGDEATLMSQTAEGSINAVDIVIRGIVDVPILSFSKRVVYAHIEHAQRLLRLRGKHTGLAVRVREPEQLASWVQKWRPLALSAGYELKGWWDIDVIIKRVERLWYSMMTIINLLLFVSASLSVLNIVFMLVAERTVEIGTLMAIGARPRDIKTIFTLEALFIGTIGGISGGIIGDLIVYILHVVGITFQNPFSSGNIIIRPTVSFDLTLGVVLFAVIVCYLAAIPPARKAAMVEPVKAFRGQLT